MTEIVLRESVTTPGDILLTPLPPHDAALRLGRFLAASGLDSGDVLTSPTCCTPVPRYPAEWPAGRRRWTGVRPGAMWHPLLWLHHTAVVRRCRYSCPSFTTTTEIALAYELIQVRTEADKVGIITLNRPKQLNALNDQLMDELGAALKAFDADEKIGCIILTGSEKAFAAGADIGAMAKYSFADAYKGDYITRNWEVIRTIRKPIIAAVSGFALGGGCELCIFRI